MNGFITFNKWNIGEIITGFSYNIEFRFFTGDRRFEITVGFDRYIAVR